MRRSYQTVWDDHNKAEKINDKAEKINDKAENINTKAEKIHNKADTRGEFGSMTAEQASAVRNSAWRAFRSKS